MNQRLQFQLWSFVILAGVSLVHTFDEKYSSKFRLDTASLSASDWLILRGVPISISALSERNTLSSKSPDDKTNASYSRETLFLQEQKTFSEHLKVNYQILE
jgi:hypothetical protein